MARAKDFGYYGIDAKHQAIILLSGTYGDRLESLTVADKVSFISAIASEFHEITRNHDVEIAEEILERFCELEQEEVLSLLKALVWKFHGGRNVSLRCYSLGKHIPLILDIANAWGDCLEYAKDYELNEILLNSPEYFDKDKPVGIDSIRLLDDDSLSGLALMISDTF